MHSKTRPAVGLVLVLPCLLLAAWGLLARGATQRDVSVQSVQFEPLTPREARRGFDTKVSVTIIPLGSSPRLANRISVGGDIVCQDARLVRISAGPERVITNQKPFVIASIGRVAVVSFLFNKSKLPKSRNVLRATIKQEFSYNVYTPAGTPLGVERHRSAGVPIEVPLH